jgi:hypothetical protein
MNEMKTMQDIKEGFYRDRNYEKNHIDILEMKSSISQIKTSIESLATEWRG